MNLKDFRLKFGFEPKLHYYEGEYFLNRLNAKEIKNSKIWGLVRKLTNLAHPSYEDQFDTLWKSFYLPLRRSGKIIVVPVHICKYKKLFGVRIHPLGSLNVNPGKETADNFYEEIFIEMLRFIPVIIRDATVIEKTLPYDIRTGKIRGKYIMKKVMSQSARENMLKRYEKHILQQQIITGISLEDYLNTAAICYHVAYGIKTRALTPEQMYRKWADGRHGGMLDIRDRKSKTAFNEWYHGGRSAGHPFEIVFSWHEHGIHLYPPSSDAPYYRLRVTNNAYADDFIKMLEALIKSKVPIEVPDLKEILEFLGGESQFAVNDYDKYYFWYSHTKDERTLFRHIEWDQIRLLKLKRKMSRSDGAKK